MSLCQRLRAVLRRKQRGDVYVSPGKPDPGEPESYPEFDKWNSSTWTRWREDARERRDDEFPDD